MCSGLKVVQEVVKSRRERAVSAVTVFISEKFGKKTEARTGPVGSGVRGVGQAFVNYLWARIIYYLY